MTLSVRAQCLCHFAFSLTVSTYFQTAQVRTFCNPSRLSFHILHFILGSPDFVNDFGTLAYIKVPFLLQCSVGHDTFILSYIPPYSIMNNRFTTLRKFLVLHFLTTPTSPPQIPENQCTISMVLCHKNGTIHYVTFFLRPVFT